MTSEPQVRGICLQRIHGGYAVRRTPGHNVFLYLTPNDWRIVARSRTDPTAIDRIWAYFGTGVDSFNRAVIGAWEWESPDNGAEPGGWNLNVQTGERRHNDWRTPFSPPDFAVPVER